MKQKTKDQELMVMVNKQAQEEEMRKFQVARIAVDRLETKRKVGISKSVVSTACLAALYTKR